MQVNAFQNWSSQILSVLRIVTAASFLTHGTMKALAWPAPFEIPMNPLLYTAAFLEVVGGLLLTVGYQSRFVSFVLSGQMAVAYFLAYGSNGFFPAVNGGETAMLFCFIFLYIAAAGPGVWSVDAASERSRNDSAVRLSA